MLYKVQTKMITTTSEKRWNACIPHYLPVNLPKSTKCIPATIQTTSQLFPQTRNPTRKTIPPTLLQSPKLLSHTVFPSAHDQILLAQAQARSDNGHSCLPLFCMRFELQIPHFQPSPLTNKSLAPAGGSQMARLAQKVIFFAKFYYFRPLLTTFYTLFFTFFTPPG